MMMRAATTTDPQELLCAVEGKTRLEVVLSPGEQATFVRALTEDFDSIAASLSKADARNASAFHARDREMIFGAVEASCGFAQLNATVAALLRAWLARCGEGALAALPAEERGASPLAQQVASLLRDLGRLSDAEALFRSALAARRERLGPRHADSLTALNNLAWLLIDMGRLAEAEQLLRECIAARREILGNAHPDTLYSLNNLARVLAAAAAAAEKNDAGRDESLAEAEALFREVVAARREQLGERHQNTLISLANLAELLGALDARHERAAEAEALLREAVEGFRASLGPRHPYALLGLNSLANLLLDSATAGGGEAAADADDDQHRRQQARREEAEKMYRQSLAGLIEQYGHRHADVLAVALNLASLLVEKKEKGGGGEEAAEGAVGGDDNAEVRRLAAEAERRRSELLPRRLRAGLRGAASVLPQ